MYRFLHRGVAGLDDVDRFLLDATRCRVGAARGSRCACRALVDEGAAGRLARAGGYVAAALLDLGAEARA